MKTPPRDLINGPVEVNNDTDAPQPLLVNELFAFVSVDEEGNEGIIGASMNIQGVGPSFVPLIGADMARVNSYKQLAENIVRESNDTKNLVLKKFKLVNSETLIDKST